MMTAQKIKNISPVNINKVIKSREHSPWDNEAFDVFEDERRCTIAAKGMVQCILLILCGIKGLDLYLTVFTILISVT